MSGVRTPIETRDETSRREGVQIRKRDVTRRREKSGGLWSGKARKVVELSVGEVEGSAKATSAARSGRRSKGRDSDFEAGSVGVFDRHSQESLARLKEA